VGKVNATPIESSLNDSITLSPQGIKFALPNVFWTRLAGKYGTTFYVKENGMDVAIEAIVSCLRNEDGYCTSPPDEGQSLKSLGLK
jgi:hypothetical protein